MIDFGCESNLRNRNLSQSFAESKADISLGKINTFDLYWVVKWVCARYLGWLEWVIRWEVYVQEKNTSLVWTISWAHNCGRPVKHIIANWASLDKCITTQWIISTLRDYRTHSTYNLYTGGKTILFHHKNVTWRTTKKVCTTRHTFCTYGTLCGRVLADILQFTCDSFESHDEKWRKQRVFPQPASWTIDELVIHPDDIQTLRQNRGIFLSSDRWQRMCRFTTQTYQSAVSDWSPYPAVFCVPQAQDRISGEILNSILLKKQNRNKNGQMGSGMQNESYCMAVLYSMG